MIKKNHGKVVAAYVCQSNILPNYTSGTL